MSACLRLQRDRTAKRMYTLLFVGLAFIAACYGNALGDDLSSRAMCMMNGAEEVVFAERNFSKT